jgi:uncharacterized protein
MRIVLDTNILWISIPNSSPSNWLIRDLLARRYTLCVTTDILEEYEEIIERFLGSETAQNFMEFLEILPNVEKVTKHIRWQLITNDPDDDKFADCYLWGNANFLVTHDKHFNVLKKRAFPKVNVKSLEEFRDLSNKMEF